MHPDIAYGLEGDTPSWLMLIPNGLNDNAIPNYGSWGGRYELYKPEPVMIPVPPVFTGGGPIMALERRFSERLNSPISPSVLLK